ncbi:MAG: hypothetical protein N3F11_09825 [Casimicrobiaceae bacterium]|nr:hypothetical protein [Casimicrobiaceae bacterium]
MRLQLASQVLRERRALFWGAVAAAGWLGLALLIQGLLLAAWRFGADSPGLAFKPVDAAPFQPLPEGDWRLPPGATVGGLLASGISLDAAMYPALEWRIEAHAQPLDIEVAWATIGALDRPKSIMFRVPPANHDRRERLQLAGAPGWSGTIARLGVVVRSAGGGMPVTVGTPRLVAASPANALAWLRDEWFAGRPAVRAAEQPLRVVPLVLWLMLALAGTGLSLWTLRARMTPGAFAASLVGAAAVFAGAALMIGVQVLAHQVLPARPTLSGLLSVALLVVVAGARGARDEGWPALARWQWALVAASVGLVTVFDRWLALGTAVAAGILALPQSKLPLARRAMFAVLFVGALVLGAAAQGLLGSPALPVGWALRDPTPILASRLVEAGLPATLAAAAGLLWILWPNQAARKVAMERAGLALVFFLPLIALAHATGALGHAGWWATVSGLVALGAWASLSAPLPERMPQRLRAIPLEERSAPVRRLYAAAALAFRDSAAAGQINEARRHLERLREIADDATETHWARLALTLAEGRVEALDAPALASYAALLERLPLTGEAIAAEQLHFTLFELAWQRGDLAALERLREHLRPGAVRTRLEARLALEREGAEAMWRVLEAAGFPQELVFERIECALLLNDLERAKQALDAAGLQIQSLPGQCYLARLKLRALGPAAVEQEITKLVTWNHEFGLAQVAAAELYRAKGQPEAAAVRIAFARRLAPEFWMIR